MFMFGSACVLFVCFELFSYCVSDVYCIFIRAIHQMERVSRLCVRLCVLSCFRSQGRTQESIRPTSKRQMPQARHEVSCMESFIADSSYFLRHLSDEEDPTRVSLHRDSVAGGLILATGSPLGSFSPTKYLRNYEESTVKDLIRKT